MLKFFSRLEKTRGVVIVSFAVLVVLGLVVAGYNRGGGAAIANPSNSREALARVGSDDVTVADYTLLHKKIESQYSQFGGQISLAQLGMTPERILDQAINARVALQEARRLGLTVSDEEVRDMIQKQFTDPASGTGFDFARYKDYVQRTYGSVPLYEQSVRDALAASKLRAYVTAGAQVSEEDVKQNFVRENTTFDLVYVPVEAADVAKKINASDDELRQYFDAHKTDYRFAEPQKQIRYVFINQEKAGEKLPISDEDLRKQYDSLAPENKMAGVRVQQIVLKVPDPKQDQDVLNKAVKLVTQIRKEDLTADEQAFADLARGNSQDPETAKSGGWLPNPVKRNPNKKPSTAATPNNVADLLQNTLDWKEGQVGDPLKTGNAYYIFRRGPAVPKTFEDAKKELEVSLRNQRSYAAAQAVAQKAEEMLKQTHDPQKVAQAIAPEANMKPEEMVKTTPFIIPGSDVPDIGSSPQFEDAIKPLEQPGQVGDRVGVKNGFAVPMLVEVRPANRIPDFDEVKDKVAQDFKQSRATEQLEQAARDLAANASTPDALKAAAEKAGFTSADEKDYHLGRPLGRAGADPALDAALLPLKEGETTKTPVKVGDRWVVVGVTKRKDADMADYDKQRPQLIEAAQRERRDQLFDEYLTEARRKLEEKGQIKIYEDTFARLQESEEPAALPQRPQLPIQLPQGK
jgi:peptidyl-prolyl cis-trans isomerase D